MARTRGPEKRTKMWALRLSEEEYEDISARAQKLDLAMSTYMINCARGIIEAEYSNFADQLKEFDRRLQRIERMADLGSFE